MNDEFKILEMVVERLEKGTVPYMITGSIAMNYYATPRMTRDLDLVVELNTADVSKFVTLFDNTFIIESETILKAIQNKGMFNIIHQQWVIKVDFIIRKPEAYRQLEFDRRRKVNAAGISFWIVSPEDLIISKLDWAKESSSDLQLRDVRNLLENQEGLDLQYVQEWVGKLGLKEIYEKIPS